MTEANTKFDCLKCGECCRDLIVNESLGLVLFPNEIRYFPSSSIEPCLGKGKKPNHSSFKIWAYQLNEMNCSNLINNSCKIYETRPRVCRQYPFSVKSFSNTRTDVSISPDCTSQQNALATGEFKEGQLSQYFEEEKYAISTARWMIKFQSRNKKKDTPWVFDMKNQKWTVASNLHLLRG